MAKFGKRSVVSTNIWDHSICLLGESGIGKTTIMAEVCEKLLGEDGYMILDCGKEDAMGGLDGYTYETVENYKTWDEITKDIIKNKKTDYPNLKILVIDTLDQMFSITAEKVINDWNREHQNDKNFRKAKTLNGVEGGFTNGNALVDKLILDRIWMLKKVGVVIWYTGHTKTTESVDAVSMQSYLTLSSSMTQKDFGEFKKKIPIVAVACKDRTIESESTGRTNIVTKKDITVNRVKDEKRQIIFRDDNYSVDSKSRFKDIVEKIPFDTDEFINAIQDALNKASTAKNTSSLVEEKDENKPSTYDKEELYSMEEVTPEENDDDIFAEETADNAYPEDLTGEIQKLFKAVKDKDLKAEVRLMIKDHGGIKNCSTEALQEIYDTLTQ